MRPPKDLDKECHAQWISSGLRPEGRSVNHAQPSFSTGRKMECLEPKAKASPKVKPLDSKYSKSDIPRLRQKWLDVLAPLQQGLPETLPPLREVNHTIPLIDEKMDYKYHYPRCPDNLRSGFFDKLNRMTRAGWWEAQSASQAAPLLCIPKPNGTVRTVLDARKRNANTVKDVTPFPDQDQI